MDNAEYSKIQRMLVIYDRFHKRLEELKQEHRRLMSEQVKQEDENKLDSLRRYIEEKF